MTQTAAEKASPPDPVYVSWSSLKRWENCRHHQLRVIEGKTERSNMGRVFLPGTVADLVQRRWLDQPDPQPGQMQDMVEKVFAETVELGESRIFWRGNPQEDQKNVKRAVRSAVRALEPWLLKNVIPYDYQPEYRFKAHMEIPYICQEGVRAPVTLRGGVDILVRRDDGKFRLYDLKMSENPAYLRQTLGQLTFYDLAVGIIQQDFDHADDWGFVCPLLEEFIIPVTVTQEDRRYMMSRIVKYAQGVWTDNWTPKSDDTGCNWCEAKGVCDKFKTVPILDQNGAMRVSFDQAVATRKQFRS